MTIGLNGPIPPRYEDENPGEAAKLVAMIAERATKGKKKPIFLNGIQPAVKSNEVGRNEKCPCGKRKPNGTPVKYKKCCGR